MADSSQPPRLTSIDALRGAIMIVMALDHVRDFIHIGAMHFNPLDLARTYPFLFFTRWITHFCAPVFSFTAGLGAYLWWRRGGHTLPQLSRFLLTRGLWLILLEFTLMRFAYTFNYSPKIPVFLLVLWVLGECMIVLAALVHLPPRLLAVLSIAAILLHNTADRVSAAQFGAFAPFWNLLHQPGAFPLFGFLFILAYPLIPWVAVMSSGFCFGQIFELTPARRQKIIFFTGAGLTLAFIVLRAINLYGDPARWTAQPTRVYALLSFLNCTKQPPSLLFLLMTLGPALIFLAWLDRRSFRVDNPLIVFGRVPLFYFVAHFYLAHLIADALMLCRYGATAWPLVTTPFPSLGGDPALFPANFGFPLWVAYAVWIAIVAGLYLPCRWFARLKSERRHWWLSYF
jgi:uncharacterized membrane protein